MFGETKTHTMIKTLSFYVILTFCFTTVGYSQDRLFSNNKSWDSATTKKNNDFLFFDIPASINGSNIDPSPISSVASDFGEKELSLKLGFPFGVDEDHPRQLSSIRNTFYVKGGISASDEVSTLWKVKDPKTDCSLSFGANHIQPYHYWTFKEGNRQNKPVGDTSSEVINWWSFKTNIDWGNYMLITPASGSDSMLFNRKESNSLVLLSYNRFFYSEVSRLRWLSCIYSIGFGYGKTNNYEELDDRKFESGTIHYNSDSSSFTSIVESTDAKVGEFKVYEGFACYGEIYFPLTNRKNKYISVYWGTKITSYAVGARDNLINGNTGLYFNIRNQQEDPKDLVGFSITGQFNQMKDLGQVDYFDKNFSVLLQATVPLRFN